VLRYPSPLILRLVHIPYSYREKERESV
jgi:hypothetical protein